MVGLKKPATLCDTTKAGMGLHFEKKQSGSLF
jgi:hypothetical protein